MLYIRNTNQQQTIGEGVGGGIQRGVANICCNPTLNSVTTASLTQLTINSTLGTFLVNCKSCVGLYIEVTEDSGSNWTTINPGNCSSENLVPMPSQSAYYRLFTSCSSVDVPNDPLTSSFSNEIFYVPNSRLNYLFSENGADANFKIIVTGSTIIDATESTSAILWEIPSASAVTASIQATGVPITGSTSMSFTLTGSNTSFTTSSCLLSTGSIFIGDYIAIPNEDYYLSASITHLPGRQAVCGTNELPFAVDSFDEANNIWYPANAEGTFTSASTAFGGVTGSMRKTNIETGDCRYNALLFSGSILFENIPTGSVMINVVSGSIASTGSIDINNSPTGTPWLLAASATASFFRFRTGNGAIDEEINLPSGTCKDRIISLSVVGGLGPVPPGSRFTFFVDGVQISTLDSGTNYTSFGATHRLIAEDESIIRTQGNSASSAMKTYYDCLYEI
jgi:hypothetical protein